MVLSSTVDINLRLPENAALLKSNWKNAVQRKYLVHPVFFGHQFTGARPHVLLSLTRVDSDRSGPSTTGFHIILTVGRTNSIGKLTVSWLALTD